MSQPSQLGLAAAQAAYQVALAMGAGGNNVGGGVIVQYKNRAANPITLVAKTWIAALYRDNIQTVPSDMSPRNFELMLQTSLDSSKTHFPPSGGIAVSDLIIWDNFEWRIEKLTDAGGYGTVFFCETVRTHPRRLV